MSVKNSPKIQENKPDKAAPGPVTESPSYPKLEDTDGKGYVEITPEQSRFDFGDNIPPGKIYLIKGEKGQFLCEQ